MRWGQLRLRNAVHLISRLRRQLPLIGEALDVSGKLYKGRRTAANLQVRSSIFFCFSKRKRWRVRNDHGGTSRRKRRLLSSVLISSFPNRELNSRFGGDFDFPPDPLEPTRKTPSVFLDFSRDSLKSNANPYCPNFLFAGRFTAAIQRQLAANLIPPYQAARSTIPVG